MESTRSCRPARGDSGHSQWRIIDLSRESGVNRSLIYYYFGRSRDGILLAAIEILGQFYFGIEAKSEWKHGGFLEAFNDRKKTLNRSPYLISFFLLQRNPAAFFHKEIRNLEKKYLKRLLELNTQANEDDVQAAYAMTLGLAVLSELPYSVVQRVSEGISYVLKR